MILLRYWQPVAGFSFGLFVMFLTMHTIHGIELRHTEAVYKANIEAEKVSVMEQCSKDKQTTQEVSHEYQNQIDSLRGELDAAKRVQPHRCIAVHASEPSTKCNGTTDNAKLSNTYAGIDSNDLLDYAGDAEQVGRQLDACQSFVLKERN